MDEMNTLARCNSCQFEHHEKPKKYGTEVSIDMSYMVPSLYNVSDDSIVHVRRDTPELQALQLKEMQDMARHLKLLSGNISQNNSESEIQMQWNYLAKFIDRICRILFLVVVVSSYLLMVLLYVIGNPYFKFAPPI